MYKDCRLHYSWRSTKQNKKRNRGPPWLSNKVCMNQPFVNINAWSRYRFFFFHCFHFLGNARLKLQTFTVPCKITQWLICNWAWVPVSNCIPSWCSLLQRSVQKCFYIVLKSTLTLPSGNFRLVVCFCHAHKQFTERWASLQYSYCPYWRAGFYSFGILFFYTFSKKAGLDTD